MRILLPEEARVTIDQYKSLKLGSKIVPCPYYINTQKESGGLRVLVGKGSPEEIEHEVKVWAQLRGFEMSKASEHEIREFMIKHRIGIDCSGFLVHVINRWMKQTRGRRLIEYLKFDNNSVIAWIKRRLRSAENIGANTLTSLKNTIKITELNDIRPGDLIRLKGRVKNSHHIAMISEIEGDLVEENGKKNFLIKRFKYVHSNRNYDDRHGVREGEVIITNPEAGLKEQNWTEVYNGRNWTYEGLVKEYQDNGVMRLKCLENEIKKNYEAGVVKELL
ncbi:hypothetical protein JW796_04200 [Candidatus Dojkabacteria bacterium]|nr:hypothetical protein [Candidatus Dojkabacteria bacterium]